MSDVTLILKAVGRGEKLAADELLRLLYKELRRLARQHATRAAAGHTLRPTAFMREAWMRLVRGDGQSPENRARFLGAASEAMRRIVVENSRRNSR